MKPQGKGRYLLASHSSSASGWERTASVSGQKKTAWGGNMVGGCHMPLRHLANLKSIVSLSDSVDERGQHQYSAVTELILSIVSF